MKLHVAGVLGVMVVALSTVGCGLLGARGAQAKVPVGTTTVTNAMVPDSPLPPALWEEDEAPVTPPVETWGVKPATPEDLEKYGF